MILLTGPMFKARISYPPICHFALSYCIVSNPYFLFEPKKKIKGKKNAEAKECLHEGGGVIKLGWVGNGEPRNGRHGNNLRLLAGDHQHHRHYRCRQQQYPQTDVHPQAAVVRGPRRHCSWLLISSLLSFH